MNIGDRILVALRNGRAKQDQFDLGLLPTQPTVGYEARATADRIDVCVKVSDLDRFGVLASTITLTGAPGLNPDELAARHTVMLAQLRLDVHTPYGAWDFIETDPDRNHSVLRSQFDRTGRFYFEAMLRDGVELTLRHYEVMGQDRRQIGAVLTVPEFVALINSFAYTMNAFQPV